MKPITFVFGILSLAFFGGVMVLWGNTLLTIGCAIGCIACLYCWYKAINPQ